MFDYLVAIYKKKLSQSAHKVPANLHNILFLLSTSSLNNFAGYFADMANSFIAIKS